MDYHVQHAESRLVIVIFKIKGQVHEISAVRQDLGNLMKTV